eukprot:m.272385 g.272385  ORF g.272385 m.272385 type:complete len:66 (-) comp17678_c0_seq5:888-1085(-)
MTAHCDAHCLKTITAHRMTTQLERWSLTVKHAISRSKQRPKQKQTEHAVTMAALEECQVVGHPTI